MAAKIEEIGLLLVHGIGEQKRLEHLRCTTKEIASYVQSTPGLIRLAVDDQSEAKGLIILDVMFSDQGKKRRIRLNCQEVWWADLGMRGGPLAETAFWLWGLGQWAAEVHWKGRHISNTSLLMDNPSFPGDAPGKPPGARKQVAVRAILFGADMLAFLTLITWSLFKRVIAFITRTVPGPELIFLFLGDVKIYQQPGGPGRGTPDDPDMPMRTTIRRRMVSAMTDMAEKRFDRWYILAHSLGSVLAFNGVQETEWALPNYLDEATWRALSADFKTKDPYTPGKAPDLANMMPRRPPWLSDKDGISRQALFSRFSGLVTYGAPLDKFAALWPRIVCVNKQPEAFPSNCEWLNIYDPTDPVGAPLDAFSQGPDKMMAPGNDGCRSSKAFLWSHIRYFTPRRRHEDPIAAPLVDAILRGTSLTSAAKSSANSPATDAARHMLAAVQILLLFAVMLVSAVVLAALASKLIANRYFGQCTAHWWSIACAREILAGSIALLVLTVVAVSVAGGLRAGFYDRRFAGK